jgi:hypothetical protein
MKKPSHAAWLFLFADVMKTEINLRLYKKQARFFKYTRAHPCYNEGEEAKAKE